MSNMVRRAAGTPLSEEALAELRALAKMPDEAIDTSDIPERTNLRNRARERTASSPAPTSMSKAS
jgi:hypothetical protein